ncbi:MAG: aminotransferase class III-fold pyridoxal phosphate-dependent enzyme [Thermoplasmata archaeon]
MDAEDDRARVRETNFRSWGIHRQWDPPLIVRAEGTRFWDAEGREYLDFASQLVATNLGHGNLRVAEAIAAQARRLPYVSPSMATGVRAELSRRLAEVVPEGVDRFFFSTSGTEANEAAIKVARGVTGRSRIIARTRSYHGATASSLAASGEVRRRAAGTAVGAGGTIFAPDCYCYRCPFGLAYPGCGIRCAAEVEEQIEREGDVAAMIVEPVVGTNGVIVPVPEYLPMLRAITRRHGVLLIADEVMTGWGRVGEWFAVQRWGVVPDLLSTAKGLTNAAAPLGLTAASRAIHDAYADRYFPHGHTYEAHPVSLAAGVAAIDEYRRLDLVRRSRTEGEYLLARLKEIASRHRSVGEVRGLGLFAAVELVRDRTRRTPFAEPEDMIAGRPLVVDAVARAMRQRGVHVLPWISHLILAPPLIVPRPEIDRAVEALDAALAVADAEAAPGPL